jgi:hypothetical protein
MLQERATLVSNPKPVYAKSVLETLSPKLALFGECARIYEDCLLAGSVVTGAGLLVLNLLSRKTVPPDQVSWGRSVGFALPGAACGALIGIVIAVVALKLQFELTAFGRQPGDVLLLLLYLFELIGGLAYVLVHAVGGIVLGGLCGALVEVKTRCGRQQQSDREGEEPPRASTAITLSP